MITLWEIIIKSAVVHTVTYFAVGIVAFKLFNYTATLNRSENNMRPASDSLVKTALLFQPLRGVLFGIVFYLLQSVLFFQTNGWFVTWVMLVIVGILSTFAPAGNSIEGFIFLKSHGVTNRYGILEILSQSLLLSVIIYYWVNHPEKIWLSWILGVLFIVFLAMPVLGLLAGRHTTSKK